MTAGRATSASARGGGDAGSGGVDGVRQPDFVHLGPDKAGSTWLHEVLVRHPEVYLTGAKDLYFFDRYYDRGRDWYLAQFHGARPEHRVVGEMCPHYLGCPEAPERMYECLGGDIRLMVTLREPVARALSSYLYMHKHGLAPPTFREACAVYPPLIEHGRYATQLRGFLRRFDRSSLRVALFDDLQADAQAFVDETCDWLGVERLPIPAELTDARLPASRARIVPVARTVRRAADWVRAHDGARLVGRVKRSALVQRVLYAPLGDDRPAMTPDDVAFLREQLADEVAGVEEEFGLPVRKLWGWDDGPE